MELRHLRYFSAVAEALSFTKAAQKLAIAQPSLTRQVRNLEEELGVSLLDRSHNRVVLTEEGRAFLRDAYRVLALCAESVVKVRQLRRAASPQLNLGYRAAQHFDWLPATLAAFRKLCPEVALNLFDLSRAEQFQALELRQIDLGFVGLPSAYFGQQLRFECVARDTMLVALPASHRLAKKRCLKLTDLGAEFFIGMAEKTHPGAREWLLEVCRGAGFEGEILQEADADATAMKCVADGLGVAFMPEQSATLPQKGVVFCGLSPPLRRESTVAWRADDVSEALHEYLQIVRDLSQSMAKCASMVPAEDPRGALKTFPMRARGRGARRVNFPDHGQA